MFRLLRGIGISWKLRSVDVQADVGNFLVGLGFLQQSYICTSGQECKIGMIGEGLAPLYFFSFYILFYLVLVNMLVTLLRSGYDIVD